MGNLPNHNKVKNVPSKQADMEVNVATSPDRNSILLEINGWKIQSLVQA